MRSDIFSVLSSILIGIALAIGIRVLTIKMQVRKKGTSFSRLILAITLVIASLFVAWATIGFTTDFDLTRTPEFQAIAFVVMLVLPLISISFARGSVKLTRLESLTRVKARAFSAFSIIFIILSGFTIGLLAQKVYIGTIRNGTGYDDGPWSTWHADPRNSITISWLTALPNATILHFGTNPALLNQVYADATPVNLHKAILLNLLPNTTYYYRIPETFSTPPCFHNIHIPHGCVRSGSISICCFGGQTTEGCSYAGIQWFCGGRDHRPKL